MKIAIAGAGALGCSYGHMLYQSGNQVVLLDNWKDHIAAINSNGLQVGEVGVEKTSKLQAYTPEEYNEDLDLIIVLTKSLGLQPMLEQIKHLLKPQTKVLCLLNGLGHKDTLSQYVAPQNILMGVTVVTASLKAPGVISFSNYGKTEIQNIVPEGEAGARQVVETINAAGLPAEYSENIMWSIWRKACLNGTMNALCTILDANMNELGSIPKAKELLRRIITEFNSVAVLDNVSLDIDAITEFVYGFTDENFSGSKHYPSMHQDLVKNRRLTEVEFLNGYVARKAQELGKSAPYNELITILVHGKESVLEVGK